MKGSFQETLLDACDRGPDKLALTFWEDGTAPDWLTREAVVVRAGRIAQALANRGIRTGSACLLVMASDEEAVLTTLAVLLLGAKPLLVAPPTIQGKMPSAPAPAAVPTAMPTAIPTATQTPMLWRRFCISPCLRD